MSKIRLTVSCPINTYSGYGARSRDLVKSLLATGKYDVTILSQRWGNTRFGYLEDHKEEELLSLIIPNLTAQPDVWIQITVPNEFQSVGKYNIGVTAGIETTVCHHSWLEGCNRMDLILTSSHHSKKVFQEAKVDVMDKNTNQKMKELTLEKPIEVLFEGVDIKKYFATTPNTSVLVEKLNSIPESFCYLSVGHWMQGDFGHDRKNIGYTVKAFLESFKNKQVMPALILKVSQANSSLMDRERILEKIDAIKKTVKGKHPNVYLLHGEVSDEDMNMLYNHPKVKVMVSHTKGEGYGRPLAEFATIGKPIIASGWSGHTDFLNKEDSILIGGHLEKLHPSSVVRDVLIPDSMWFTPNDTEVARAFKETYKHYKDRIVGARKLRRKILDNFTLDNMTSALADILDKNIPEFPKEIKLTLPKLNLPKLEKIDG
jgi:hypothetical protein